MTVQNRYYPLGGGGRRVLAGVLGILSVACYWTLVLLVIPAPLWWTTGNIMVHPCVIFYIKYEHKLILVLTGLF